MFFGTTFYCLVLYLFSFFCFYIICASVIFFVSIKAVLVHTNETIRIRYFLDLLMETKRPVMLVGNAGCGKTVLAGEKFASLDPDKVMVANVPFNYYTTSAMLQQVLEKPLEKKAGRNYGPPGAKRLVYFIDDMNMPEVKKKDTFLM